MSCDLKKTLATHGESAHGRAFAIGLLAVGVNPPVRCVRWGCPWDALTVDIISCCYSLSTVMLNCRALLATHYSSTQEQAIITIHIVSSAHAGKTKYEGDEIRTHDPTFVGYMALPTGPLSHVTVEQV